MLCVEEAELLEVLLLVAAADPVAGAVVPMALFAAGIRFIGSPSKFVVLLYSCVHIQPRP
jgi:hypothetical protein